MRSLVLMHATRYFVAFCCSIPLLAASAAQSRHGDAVLVDKRGFSFLPEPADHLDFPKISLSAPRTYRYRVSELPQVIYPSGFSLDVPRQENEFGVRREYAWSRCVLRASLMTPAGRVFHRRTYRLGRDRAGSHPGNRGRRAVYFVFTDYSVSGTTRLELHGLQSQLPRQGYSHGKCYLPNGRDCRQSRVSGEPM
jgi:hypothetical protein